MPPNLSRRTKEGLAVSAERIPVSRTTSDALQAATPLERLRLLRETIATEGHAILDAAAAVSAEAVRAAEMTAACEGCVVVTGVGKAGLVGQKLVATLASTGTPAHFLHPAEAVHGDLGRIRENDLVWAFSNSGRSEEVVRIAPHLRVHSAGLIAVTATEDNPLAAAADCVVSIGRHRESCPHGLAPTSSTAVMMAVGDAIAMLASRLRQFTPQDFARFHPGGALGRKLATVDEVMRRIDACRMAEDSVSIREAMVASSRDGRRSGAVMLINREGCLAGLFTDSDLARLLEARHDAALDQPIAKHMMPRPKTVEQGSMLQEAIALMSHERISELPVIDAHHRPVGMLDITDIVSLGEIKKHPATIQMRR